jgi:hypothetical protein
MPVPGNFVSHICNFTASALYFGVGLAYDSVRRLGTSSTTGAVPSKQQ